MKKKLLAKNKPIPYFKQIGIPVNNGCCWSTVSEVINNYRYDIFLKMA